MRSRVIARCSHCELSRRRSPSGGAAGDRTPVDGTSGRGRIQLEDGAVWQYSGMVLRAVAVLLPLEADAERAIELSALLHPLGVDDEQHDMGGGVPSSRPNSRSTETTSYEPNLSFKVRLTMSGVNRPRGLPTSSPGTIYRHSTDRVPVQGLASRPGVVCVISALRLTPSVVAHAARRFIGRPRSMLSKTTVDALSGPRSVAPAVRPASYLERSCSSGMR